MLMVAEFTTSSSPYCVRYPPPKGKSGSTREFRWSSKDFNFIWIENFRVKPDDDNSFSIFITAMIDAISEHLQLLIQIFGRTFSVSTKID